jgi:threonine dehydrogenase-like Zn-dependent dehydrogenase
MKALVVDAPGSIQLRDIPEPPLPFGECRVAVTRIGICRTDLELVKGYMNFTGVPGHEFVGKVVEGADRLMGRRVVGEINAGCGTCDECRANGSRHCLHRTVLGIFNRPGAFAETLTLPERNLLPVPDNVSDEEAVFTEPLAAALEIVQQLHIRPTAKALVIGDGKLGLLIAQVFAHFSTRVMLLGRNPKKLALAERWCIPSALADRAALSTIHFGGRFDCVIECTGSPEGLAAAMNHVAPGGTIVLKSTYAPTLPPSIDWAKVVVDEIRIVGSRCGPFAPALRLLAKGGIDVRSLVDHQKSLDDGIEAFELAAQKGVLKVLVRV